MSLFPAALNVSQKSTKGGKIYYY